MILIDKPIPEDCDYCFYNDDGDKCGLLNESFPLYFSGRLPNCPLREMEKADDPISRQAAIDTLTEYGNGRAVYISVEEAVRRIEQLPSAQPEIIRCKDCIHRPVAPIGYDNSIDNGFDLMFPDYICPCGCEDGYYAWYPKDSFYCGNAERRTDG